MHQTPPTNNFGFFLTVPESTTTLFKPRLVKDAKYASTLSSKTTEILSITL